MSNRKESEQRGIYFFVNAFLLTFIEEGERIFDKEIFTEKEKAPMKGLIVLSLYIIVGLLLH